MPVEAGMWKFGVRYLTPQIHFSLTKSEDLSEYLLGEGIAIFAPNYS